PLAARGVATCNRACCDSAAGGGEDLPRYRARIQRGGCLFWISDTIGRLSDRPLAFRPAGNRSAVGARRLVLSHHLVHEFLVAGACRPVGTAAAADCPGRRSLASAVAA